MSFVDVPSHLKKYVVEQDYSRYTPIDQAVWRCILRQLRSYLSEHAHPVYLDGLAKTGIDVDQIPRIDDMSLRIQKFGWRAVAVSGFIPPAAFMELQACGFLPIASDMRTINHLLYTPAPDIVHEAAGHAPILVDHAFASYLKSYAQVARKAIINKRDMELYEAIRELSDLKESPDSTPEQIAASEKHLEEVSASMGEPSEAAILGRMNWWTAEYGLIGDLDNPRIFGAGLLSSVGEATSCLDPKVKKIPLTIDCINYSYDITEKQPQLFVTPDFETLTKVLSELASQMSFKRGGVFGLQKAKNSFTVNTVELNSGLQISGVLKDFITEDEEPAYLQFEGPSQLSINMKEIPNQGRNRHPFGFGSPVGLLAGHSKCLSEFTDAELNKINVAVGNNVELEYASGVVVTGKVTGTFRSSSGKLLLVSFTECKVVLKDKLLFDPAWGDYDMAIGCEVVSVFGGPADRESYGFSDVFVAQVIPRRTYSKEELAKHRLYAEIRRLRETVGMTEAERLNRLDELITILDERYPTEWLPALEILEIGAELSKKPSWFDRLLVSLKSRPEYQSPESPLRAGIKLLHLN